MSNARVFVVLGVWMTILPYLGFPYSWKDIFVTISGLLLIYLSYTLHQKSKSEEVREETFDNFSENKFTEELENSKQEVI